MARPKKIVEEAPAEEVKAVETQPEPQKVSEKKSKRNCVCGECIALRAQGK